MDATTHRTPPPAAGQAATMLADYVAGAVSAAIAAADADLAAAKHARLEAEKKVYAAREAESAAAGRVAVAIAKAIQRGADPALVLPFEMLRAQRVTRIIARPAELTIKRMSNSLSITGSRFPGWMEVTVGELFVHYMPTPMWQEWSEADEERRSKMSARNSRILP